MKWVSVMRLPDGRSVDMPVPSADDTDPEHVHRFRVRGDHVTMEFATLPEVIDHLVGREDRRPPHVPVVRHPVLDDDHEEHGELVPPHRPRLHRHVGRR
jgi:hypothetical protein